MTTKAQTDAEKLRAEHPDSWIAVEPGDTLEGVVTEVTRAWSDQKAQGDGDGFYPLLRVETLDGATLAFHAFTTVAYNQVMEKQPIPGEKIVVTYQGESTSERAQAKAKAMGRSVPRVFHVSLPDRDPKAAASAVYGTLKPGRGGNNQPTTATEASDQEEIGF